MVRAKQVRKSSRKLTGATPALREVSVGGVPTAQASRRAQAPTYLVF
jgi:hypothetical protein